jgi:hypothetical protein
MIHGCAEDCGMELNLTRVVITVDFTSPTEGEGFVGVKVLGFQGFRV